MPRYEFLLQDAYTLDMLGTLPLKPTEPYTRLLSGCGAFGGEIPLDHAMATRANFKDRATNLVVLRDAAVDWWGLVVDATPNEDARTVALSCREPTIWWQMRTIEDNKHYNADICSIVRKMWTHVTTKTDGGSINANLDNITISTGLAGVTRRVPIPGSARLYMQDAVDWIIDNDTGLEYRCDYSGTRDDPQCTIRVGTALGTAKNHKLTEHVLARRGRGLDWNPQRSATRAHAVGAGFTATKQNTGSVTAGLPLTELVIDRSNTADHDLLNDAAREARRKAQPPVQPLEGDYTPHAHGLTINLFEPGDTAPWDTGPPDLLTVTGTRRRIVGVGVMPQAEDAEESLNLMLNLPLDELGV